MQYAIFVRPALIETAAAFLLLAFYFLIITLVAGFGFAKSQFAQFWYFIVVFASAFGIQVGLYIYLERGHVEVIMLRSNLNNTPIL